jgi:hypothetical protein
MNELTLHGAFELTLHDAELTLYGAFEVTLQGAFELPL